MESMARHLTAHLLLPKANPLDFSAPLLRLQDRPPNPLGQRVLWVLLAFLAALLLWAIFGQLDIVAVAEGKLIPQSYVKIVQPAEAGIVKRILVREGASVHAGQVLMQMDTLIAEADTRSLAADAARKRLSIRRIDAELAGQPFRAEANDAPDLVREIEPQYRANRAALSAALAEERARLIKAQREWAAATQVKQKLEAILPHYRAQDKAFEKLAEKGFAGSIMSSDKKRERIEKEQELEAQGHLIASAEASIAQSQERLVQIEADARQKLYTEKKRPYRPTRQADGGNRQAGAPASPDGAASPPGWHHQGSGHPHGGDSGAARCDHAYPGAERRSAPGGSLDIQ